MIGRLVCLVPGASFCRADEFVCNNTLCKLHMWVCDGRDDCGDNSDEDADMCGRVHASFQDSPSRFSRPLTTDAYDGRSSAFVSPTAAKRPCPPTRPFRCRNDRVCLRVQQVCNRVDDCGDNSDEDECGETRMHCCLRTAGASC